MQQYVRIYRQPWTQVSLTTLIRKHYFCFRNGVLPQALLPAATPRLVLRCPLSGSWGYDVFAVVSGGCQPPPDVSMAILKQLQPIIDTLPARYRIEQAGPIEESGKATQAMAPLFPIMIAITLLIIILQVRSMSAMVMVFLTSPLGLIGVVPTLLLFNQPFGINALVGLIALSGILMRNTLILIGQIHHNEQEGLSPFDAVVEATVQRARPVLLTAMAAILAFIPLTHSVFWGTLAYPLIGGTFGGTIITLVFLPAMYAIWFKIRLENKKHIDKSVSV